MGSLPMPPQDALGQVSPRRMQSTCIYVKKHNCVAQNGDILKNKSACKAD